MKIIIDAGPLGLLTNKNTKNVDITECRVWAKSLLKNGFKICIPEIAYYEVRRELVRTKKLEGVKRLDSLKDVEGFEYIKITTDIIVKASEIWAWARNTGQKTANDDALDADVILAATAIIKSQEEGIIFIATTNVQHIQRYYTNTKNWKDQDWLKDISKLKPTIPN
jgi:predicted nucleic acid-binding protein